MADLKVKHCHFLMLFVTKHQDFCYISLPKAFAVFFSIIVFLSCLRLWSVLALPHYEVVFGIHTSMSGMMTYWSFVIERHHTLYFSAPFKEMLSL